MCQIASSCCKPAEKFMQAMCCQWRWRRPRRRLAKTVAGSRTLSTLHFRKGTGHCIPQSGNDGPTMCFCIALKVLIWGVNDITFPYQYHANIAGLIAPASDFKAIFGLIFGSWMNVMLVCAPAGWLSGLLGWGATPTFLLVPLLVVSPPQILHFKGWKFWTTARSVYGVVLQFISLNVSK